MKKMVRKKPEGIEYVYSYQKQYYINWFYLFYLSSLFILCNRMYMEVIFKSVQKSLR
jgi:hypothetical protein